MTSKRLAALSLLAGAGLVLAGCGGDDPEVADTAPDTAADYADSDVDTIRADFNEAMAGLESMRIAGSITEDGQTITVDMAMDTAGTCTGSLTSDDLSFQILLSDGAGYMKAEPDTWDSFAPGASELIGDRWVAGFPLDDFDDFCSLEELLSEMTDTDDDEGDATVAGTGEIDGVPTVKISSTDETDGTVTIEIAATEPHYVLQASSGESGSMKFTDFNEPVEVTLPSAEETIDFSALS